MLGMVVVKHITRSFTDWKNMDNKTKYIPKTFTLRTFNRWVSQYIDKYNWGDDKQYHYSMDRINTARYKSYIKLREKPHPNPYYRDICLQDHLYARNNPEEFVYATANPFSDVCMLCGDIDAIEGYGYHDCEQAVLYLKSRFFPDLYYEPSSSMNGIHFYIFIDFSSFPQNENKFNVFNRHNCNKIIFNLSTILYALIYSMFYCSFDKFCGNYSIYSFKQSPISLVRRGTMMKLPCPQSTIQFLSLVHSHVYTHNDIDKIFTEIDDLNKHADSPTIYPYNYLGSTFDNNSINTDYIMLYNPIDRYRISTQQLMRILGRSPDYHEWNTYYESLGWNTGDATENREILFNRVVDYVEQAFDITKVGTADYHKPGQYLYLLREIKDEYLKEINKDSRNKVRLDDIEMGLGYVGFVLCSQGVVNIDTEYIFTVEQNGLIEYVNRKVECGETKRKAHKSRAGRVFKALVDYGFIVRVDGHTPTWKDENGKVVVKGKCRKYVLTDKHPQYFRFLDIYGIPTVSKWLDRIDCNKEKAEIGSWAEA